MIRRLLPVLLASLVTGLCSQPVRAADEPISFNKHIRPILAEHCLSCHGFDAKKREADLRLDDAASALEDRGAGAAIVPGDVQHSEAWQRIHAEDESVRMPPPETNKQLTDEQRELLRRWIEQGAPYQKHWAFESPQQHEDPLVQQSAWPRGSLDRFILARLESEGLQPRPEADKETLIRRVSFALTGLPPTVEQVSQFLADSSPNAYELMVERYLESPHFGEEMARHWLDVARYADTHGLHLDNERKMWIYRDWVVQAMNDNLPYDQFTTWQIAGDLLPEATTEQLIATGFNRCNVTTSEGGSIPEEFLYRYAVERASTVVQTWMGLTGGCATCHDHKYDPLSTQEFYSLYAFFYSAADPAMDGNVSDTPPFLKVPRPGQQQRLDAAQQQEANAWRQLDELAATVAYQDPAELAEAPATKPATDVLFDDAFPRGTSVRNTSRNASVWVEAPEFGAPSGRRVLRQANSNFHEEVIQYPLQPVIAPNEGKIEVWLRTDPQHVPQVVALIAHGPAGERRATWGHAEAFASRESNPQHSVHRGDLPAAGEWTRLELPLDQLGIEPGQRISSITLQEIGGVVWWDALTISGTISPSSDPRESLAAWWKGIGSNAPPEVPGEIAELLTAGPDKADDAARGQVRRFYLAAVARPATAELAAFRDAWESARAERMAAADAIPGTMIFREVDTPREAFVMLRGQYDKPGDKVEPGVPAVFPPLDQQSEGRATRLDLARWLVSPQHPLTARVAVNRFWQQFFGTGLVKTSYDFGTQGELPSHPELLDRLAVDFREDGWNVKNLVRRFVLSATFRQSSAAPPELYQRDPENRLLARGPRFRLDAEQIRDNALAVSGLLSPALGGPGTNPYQPPEIWEPVGYADSNTRYYLQDYGQQLYRRSLYTFLKRTAPPPFMSNFDAPNREQFCTRRERSNTPLQALQLMNDVQHFEAARALAERAISEAGADPEARVEHMYRIVLARRPQADEQRLVLQLLAHQQALFAADPESARQAIHVGETAPRQVAGEVETAAWTMIANLVLNLDETLNRN